MSAGSGALRYAGLTLAVDCDDPADRAWLAEFLEPWFEPCAAEGADARVSLVADAAAFGAARDAGARPGASAQAGFLADGGSTELVPWGAEGSLHFDPQREVFYALEGGARHVRVLARPGRRFARVAWMRAVRELATDHVLRSGHPLLHAAAVVREGRAVAFAGPRRAGKSSCLLHALRAPGAAYLANDRLALLPGSRVRGMPTIVRLRAGSLAFFPSLAERARRADYRVSDALGEAPDPGPAWPRPEGSHGVSAAQLLALLGAPAAAEASLHAVVFPRVTGRPGSFELTRLSEGAARRRAAEAFFQVGPPAAARTVFSGAREKTRRAPQGGLEDAAAGLAAAVACFECRLGTEAFAGPPGEFLAALLDPGAASGPRCAPGAPAG